MAMTLDSARAAVAAVADPEIPVLTIEDLGILRDVSVGDDGTVTVTITPTYSGCPAMEVIRAEIESVLAAAGYPDVTVRSVLSPAWTTDSMTESGRRKLEEFGIAPPTGRRAVAGGPVLMQLSVRCPQCGSTETQELSHFGSTACKALYRCNVCREPFDHFKVI